MKTPHTKAAEIASLHDNAINCLKSMLRHGIATLSEGGMEQETFDALPAFGKVPAKVLGAYSAFYAALAAIGEVGGLEIPDAERYVVNTSTGAVTYVAPPVPEPVVFPEPEP
jgi:hypothetical protein